MKKSRIIALVITVSTVTLGASCTSTPEATIPSSDNNSVTQEIPTINENKNAATNLAAETDSDDFILTDIDPSVVYSSGSTSASTLTGTVDLASIDHIRGTGGITILEYGDTECPYTQDFQPTMEQILQDYDGQVQWGYKHFPLNQHTKAPFEAEATECAGAQNKFWEYTDRLFEITPANNELDPQQLMTVAETVGLDLDVFSECLRTATYKSTVQADAAEIQALGGNSTPLSLVLDDQGHILTTIEGALPADNVRQILEPYIK